MSVEWSELYAHRLAWMNTSVIREILKTAQSAETISLAGGWPEAALFPVAQFKELCEYVLDEMPRESLQYGLTDGFPPLRKAIADYTTRQGVPCATENVVITSGSQQALDLVGRLFVDEGDTVAVQNPTFLGALQSFNAYGPRYLALSMDAEGLALEGLEERIAEQRPKFIYLIPNFHNPTGVTMSLARREQVLAIAQRYNVAIVEDDPYGPLRYEGEPVPSLLQLASAASSRNASSYAEGHVLYLSTFSKLLCPGFRVAWVICPPEIAQQLVMAKQGADLQTNSLTQTISYEFMRRGWLAPQTERIRAVYRERRDAMCAAIAEFFPPSVRHTSPQGGLFLWVTLPERADAVELLREAARENVAFVPGQPFYVDGGGRNTLRLSFACVPPATIREGIRRLGEVLARHL